MGIRLFMDLKLSFSRNGRKEPSKFPQVEICVPKEEESEQIQYCPKIDF
jgi:hypothetical protein